LQEVSGIPWKRKYIAGTLCNFCRNGRTEAADLVGIQWNNFTTSYHRRANGKYPFWM